MTTPATSLDREYTGRTFWHDGICWLVVRDTVGAERPTILSMGGGRHSLDWSWALGERADLVETPGHAQHDPASRPKHDWPVATDDIRIDLARHGALDVARFRDSID